MLGRVTGWRYILGLLHCSWSVEEDHNESHLGISKWVVDKVWSTQRIITSLTYYGCLSELELNSVNIVVSGCQIWVQVVDNMQILRLCRGGNRHLCWLPRNGGLRGRSLSGRKDWWDRVERDNVLYLLQRKKKIRKLNWLVGVFLSEFCQLGPASHLTNCWSMPIEQWQRYSLCFFWQLCPALPNSSKLGLT